MSEPLSREDRQKYLSALPQTLRDPKSWQMRYEATVRSVEAERDAERERADYLARFVAFHAEGGCEHCRRALAADDKARR